MFSPRIHQADGQSPLELLDRALSQAARADDLLHDPQFRRLLRLPDAYEMLDLREEEQFA